MEIAIELLIKDIEKNLPISLRVGDLITLGLFKSRSDLVLARKRGQAPPSIKLTSRKIVYPRAALCAWLKDKAVVADEKEGEHDPIAI